jgi:hypothetical protein
MAREAQKKCNIKEAAAKTSSEENKKRLEAQLEELKKKKDADMAAKMRFVEKEAKERAFKQTKKHRAKNKLVKMWVPPPLNWAARHGLTSVRRRNSELKRDAKVLKVITKGANVSSTNSSFHDGRPRRRCAATDGGVCAGWLSGYREAFKEALKARPAEDREIITQF